MEPNNFTLVSCKLQTNESLNYILDSVKSTFLISIEKQIKCYLNGLDFDCDQDAILLIDVLLFALTSETLPNKTIFSNNLDEIYSNILSKINNGDSYSSQNKWLLCQTAKRFNLKIDQVKFELINLQIALQEYGSGQEVIDILKNLPINKEKLFFHLKNILFSAPWLSEIIISKLLSLSKLNYIDNQEQWAKDINLLFFQCLSQALNDVNYDLVYYFLNIANDDILFCDTIQLFIKNLVSHLQTNEITVDLDKFYSCIIGKPTFKLAKLFEDCDWLEKKKRSKDLTSLIINSATREFDVKNCHLLTIFEKKHFLLELMYTDLSSFNTLPDKLKMIYLLDNICQCSLLNSNLEKCQSIINVLEKMVNSSHYESYLEQDPLHSSLVESFKCIFKFIDWCSLKNSSINSENVKVSMFIQLSQGQSPLSILNKFGILKLEQGHNDADVHQNIFNFLNESKNQYELMLWYGFRAIKLSIMWILNEESDDEDIANISFQIKETINEIFPLSFRVEVLENIFSLLFLLRKWLIEENDNDPDEDGYCDDSFTNQRSSSEEDLPPEKQENSTKTNSSFTPSNTALYSKVKDTSQFLFPNNLVYDYLSMLKETLLQTQTALITYKWHINETKPNLKKEVFNEIPITSSITSYSECKRRLNNLMQYINDAQWRYFVIEPAFVEQKLASIRNLSSSNTKNSAKSCKINGKVEERISIDIPKLTSMDEISDFTANKATLSQSNTFSLISCMLASSDQLLRYCLIENQIDRAKQVYELFSESLEDNEATFELLIIEKLKDLQFKLRSFLNPTQRKNFIHLNETATHGLKISQIHLIIHEFLIEITSHTSGQIATDYILIDFSICSSNSIELTQILLETSLRSLSINQDLFKKDVKNIREFFNRFSSLVLILKDCEHFKNSSLSVIFSQTFDSNLFENPKALVEKMEMIRNLKSCIKKVQSFCFQESAKDDDPSHITSDSVNSQQLILSYQKLMKSCPTNGFNYLKALFYHTCKVKEALIECRKRSENFSKFSLMVENGFFNFVFKNETILSVLYKSPSAILCSMVIKCGVPPKLIDDLAKEMKVDLLGTLCSVACPSIPAAAKQEKNVSEFNLIDSCHPALCELIQNYLIGSNSMETSVLIQDYFDDGNSSFTSAEKAIIKNEELLQYFRSKSSILFGLLTLMNFIKTEEANKEINFLDVNSPLYLWVDLIKSKFTSDFKDDFTSTIILALYPKIPVYNSVVKKLMEKHAVNQNYIKIYEMLKLLDFNYTNSSLETLKFALLVKLAKETKNVKYALQISCLQTMRNVIFELVFESDVYIDSQVAEKVIKSAISRIDKHSNQEDLTDIKESLQKALNTVCCFSKIGILSGLKAWKYAYDNLTEIDVLTILKSKKQYLLVLDYYKVVSSDSEDPDVIKLRQELTALAFCKKQDTPSLINFFNSIENPFDLAEKLVQILEDFDCREYLIKFMLDNEKFKKEFNKVDYYTNYSLGLKLIKNIPPSNRIHYESLVAKPFLIIEQMLMNLEYEALEDCIRKQRLINCDNLIEIYAKKAVDVEIVDNDSLTGSDTTMISSSILTDISFQSFTMPTSIPSKDQWVPDYKATICMLCKIGKFSMFNRKHHCRRCGRVVCRTCSQKFLIIPEILLYRSVRVCDDCYEQMQSKGSSRKDSLSSSSTIKSIQWILTLNEAENEAIKEDFYYESAPSSSLCLSLLKLHSDKKQCIKVIIDKLSRPLFDYLVSNRVDYGLIINLIKSLLLSAKVLINEDDTKLLLEINFLLSRVDIVKMLVDSNCLQRDLISLVLSKENASVKLQEKLIEMEHFDLSYNIATKYGLNLNEIRKTCAIVCLKFGQFEKARKNFKSCFRNYSGNIKAASALLQTIFDVLEKSKTKISKESIREKCKAIRSGQLSRIYSRTASDSESTLPQVLIDEGLYYLKSYGTKEDSIRFFVRFGLYKNAIQLFLNEANPSAYFSLFVTGLLLPCLNNGTYKKVLNLIQLLDPTFIKSWKYLIYSCKYFSSNQFYHVLHSIQVFMGDYIRAAMTQIKFYLYPQADSYEKLYERIQHLMLAKQHCRDFLANREQLNKGCLSFSIPDVVKQIRIINIQIEITVKFFESKIQVSKNFFDNFDFGLLGNEKNSKDDQSPPTLLDQNIARKTQLAALILIEGGSSIPEGFSLTQQVIKDHFLDADQVYRFAGKILAKSQKVNLVHLVSELLDCIRASKEEDCSFLCDDVIGTCVRNCNNLESIDPLIKLMRSDINKIDAFILCEKFKSAYILAIRSKRVTDVKRIHAISIQKNKKTLRKICESWLEENS